jgi:hypothetical protein
MSNAVDLQNVEIAIQQHKAAIARKDCLVRLQQNRDFQELIEKGFLESHAVRQVLLKAHPGLQEPAQQNLLDQQITAIGGLKQFLISVYTEGMNAQEALRADEATREELLREDLNDAEGATAHVQ